MTPNSPLSSAEKWMYLIQPGFQIRCQWVSIITLSQYECVCVKCVYVRACVCVCVWMYVCMYVQLTYMCVYIHIYIYIYQLSRFLDTSNAGMFSFQSHFFSQELCLFSVIIRDRWIEKLLSSVPTLCKEEKKKKNNVIIRHLEIHFTRLLTNSVTHLLD